LWDLKGQHFQAPIWELLGGRCRDRVRLHLLMAGGTPEEVARNARAAAEEGFTAIKFDPIPAGFQDLTLDGLIGAAVDRVAAASSCGRTSGSPAARPTARRSPRSPSRSTPRS